jgi:DNA-binding NtrC family response regulator
MAVVLVVEDEAIVLSMLSIVLKKLGHDMITARTFPEAQTIIHSDQKFDLVFTDVGLTEDAEGGATIGQLVQRFRFGTPVLYTSGGRIPENLRLVFAERHDFLQKPYTAQALARAIATALSTSDGDDT